MSRSALIRRLGTRLQGVTTEEVAEFEGCTRKLASHSCTKLAVAGQVFAARVDSRTVHYFTHVGMRDAFLKQIAESQASRVYSRGTFAPAQRAPWTSDTPAVIPPHVVVQQCPGFMPRFQPIVVPGAPRSYFGAMGKRA
jgi:hypothetical protein